MCPQERSSLISMVASLLVNAVILVRLQELAATGALEGPDAPAVWAKVVVWALPAMIGLVLALHIGFKLLTDREGKSVASDERDRLFQVRGMIVTIVVFSLGWVATMIGLANGWTPLVGFLVVYYAAVSGDLLGNAARLVWYRMDR